MLLSKDEVEGMSRNAEYVSTGEVRDLLDTIAAMRVALEAWVSLSQIDASRDHDGQIRAQCLAIDLTERAGIALDWPEAENLEWVEP